MRIDEVSKQIGLISASADAASRAKTGENRVERSEPDETGESAARIELSKTSVEYQRIAEAARTDQPGRAEHIAQLREAVEKGQYDIDSSQVAEKMVLEGLMDVLKP